MTRCCGMRSGVLVLAVAALVVGAAAVRSTVRAFREGEREIASLEQRLAAKRRLVRRQQAEMAQVAGAVDTLVRATLTARERTLAVRQLDVLEGAEGAEPGEARLHQAALESPTSAEAERALAELEWLAEQTTDIGEAVGALAAVLARSRVERGGVPSRWPVRGDVRSTFGMRDSPWGGGRRMHTGIDIQAAFGTPALSSADGEVVFTGREGGYGAMVIVDHGGGIKTVYAHLSAIWVDQGQRVRAGEAVGAVGQSGRTTGVHLHYEVRVDGDAVDPMAYLGGRMGLRRVALR